MAVNIYHKMMNDIENIIEDIHQKASVRRREECVEPQCLNRQSSVRNKSVRRYVAVTSAVAAVMCLVLLPKDHEQYVCSHTSSGVKVFCEENSNADEVVARMESVMKTLSL